MSSIVLDNSLEALFSLINAVGWWKFTCDANLKQLTSCTAFCLLSGTNSQTFINNSIDEWKQRLEAVIKDNGAHIEHLFK